MKNYKKTTKKGMTLVEILVALSVVVTSILAIYGVFIIGMSINLHTKYKATAYHIAKQEMEIIRTTSFSGLSNQDKGPFIGEVSGLNNLPSPTTELTIADYQGDTNIKQVTVEVSWLEKTTTKKVNLVTLVSKEGLNP